MKTKRNQLPCAVFGHNLEPFSNHFQQAETSNVFICSSCGAKMVTSASGDFQELPYKNNKIASALRQLFLLNRKSPQREFSL